MKERPIPFSAPMVRAILAGTKTQTRREYKARNGGVWPNINDRPGMLQVLRSSPYGQPGDRLWVKETWRTADTLDALSPSVIAEKCLDAGYSKPWAPLQWDADGQRNKGWSGFGPGNGVVVGAGKTRVSIHMPRWASRITLEVTGVRVERLQDISEADAMAEGIFPHVRGGWHWLKHDPSNLDDWNQFGYRTAVLAYQALFEQINGPGSWDANPWVWCVGFKRLEQST